jgi:UDP-glucose 4-epimerase
MGNSLDRWICFTDLIGDHAGLVVIQSLSDTMSNMLKMAASSHMLSKQLSVEALLEQGHQMDLALHTKQLIETFEQVHTPFSFYTENCHPRSACVVHCRVVFPSYYPM